MAARSPNHALRQWASLDFSNSANDVSSRVHRRVQCLDNLASIGIIANGLPAWLFVPSSLSGCSVGWLQTASFPTLPQKHCTEKLCAQLGVPLHQLNKDKNIFDIGSRDPVSVLLIDSGLRPPGSSHSLWSNPEHLCVICWQQVRKGTPKGWQVNSKLLDHKQLGGVTDWQGRVSIYFRDEVAKEVFWLDSAFESVPGQFNHCVLDPMARGHTSPGPSGTDYDSSRSLFPTNVLVQDWKQRFRLPCETSPTGFVRRALTPEEGLRLFDVPQTLTGQMEVEDKRTIPSCLSIPVKVVVAISQCLGHFLHQIKADGVKQGGTGGGGG
jgi:hypothetical protein